MGESRLKRVLVMPCVYIVYVGDSIMKTRNGRFTWNTIEHAEIMQMEFAKRLYVPISTLDIKKFKLEEVND